MRQHSVKNTEALLQRQNVAQRAIALNKINQQVKQALDCQDQCRVANYRQGILVIELASSSWTWRLNYQKNQLIKDLRNQGLPNLKNIEFTINPELNTLNDSSEHTNQRKPISSQTADHLTEIKHLASSKLSERLERLANLAQKKR